MHKLTILAISILFYISSGAQVPITINNLSDTTELTSNDLINNLMGLFKDGLNLLESIKEIKFDLQDKKPIKEEFKTDIPIKDVDNEKLVKNKLPINDDKIIVLKNRHYSSSYSDSDTDSYSRSSYDDDYSSSYSDSY
jgi:hypothetical protein